MSLPELESESVSMTLSKGSTSVTARYGEVEALLQIVGTPEFHETRKAAFAAFEAVGLPTTRDEEYKYTSLKVVADTEYVLPYGLNIYRDEITGTIADTLKDQVIFAFVNGQYAPELGTEATLPDGCFLGTIEEAFEAIPDVVDKHLTKYAADYNGKLGSTNDPRFVNLNTAHLAEGAVLYLSKGVTLEHKINFLFVSKAAQGAFAQHPRLLIVLEEGAMAKVTETYLGLDPNHYFTNVTTEIVLERQAQLEHNKVQAESDSAVHVGSVQIWQEERSVYTGNNVCLGSSIARNDINAYINGERCETWLNGAYAGLGNQVLDNHTRIDHAKANCNSFEVYKGVLGDKAHGVFNGKIFVYEDAQKTDAKQTNKAVLLSNEAQLDTKPQLEIFADDVKCTHGASIGELQKDAKFYLQARGIPANQAEALLVYAFVAEVIEKISVEAVREGVEKALYEKLGTGRA